MRLSSDDKLDFNSKYSSYNDLTIDKKLTVQEKASASKTEVWFCTLSNGRTSRKVVVKFSKLNPKNNNTDLIRDIEEYETLFSYIYESQIYNYIHKNIIEQDECFNFVGFVGCLNPDSTDIQLFFGSTNLHSILITEYDENISMNKLFQTTALTRDEVKSILSQLYYTLIVMEKHCLLHNDLHCENVLIKILENEEKMCFRVDNEIYTINSRFVIKIFDWDKSYCKSVGINPCICHYKFPKKEDLRRLSFNMGMYNIDNDFRIVDSWKEVKLSEIPEHFHVNDDGSIKVIKTVVCKDGLELKKSDKLFKPDLYGEDVILNDFNSIELTTKQLERMNKVKRYQQFSDKYVNKYYLTSGMIKYIFEETKHPFDEYEQVCVYLFDNTLLQNFDYYEPNVKKSLQTPLELFKKYANRVEECKSDYSVNTDFIPFEVPKTRIKLSFEEIQKLVNSLRIVEGVSMYHKYMIVLMIAKSTSSFRVAKDLLSFAISYNHGIHCTYDFQTVCQHGSQLKLYSSDVLEEFFNGVITSEKFLKAVDCYHEFENEMDSI